MDTTVADRTPVQTFMYENATDWLSTTTRINTNANKSFEIVNCTSNISSTEVQFPEIWRVVIGTSIFTLVLPLLYVNISCFPLGPLAASLVGAILMVLCQVLQEDEFHSLFRNEANISAVFLLLTMAIFALYAHRLGLINYLLQQTLKPSGMVLSYLWRVSLISFILSGIFSVDATCALYVPIILKSWEENERSAAELETILLALSTSANLGSVISIWGSLHMALIAAHSAHNPYGFNILHQRNCIIYLMPAAVLGWTINLVCLMLHYLANKKRMYKLYSSSSPTSIGDHLETPTGSKQINCSVAYISERKTNGILNPSSNNHELSDTQETLLGAKEAEATIPYILETINEDEELEIVTPIPVRYRSKEVDTAPIADNELIEDLEEESEFEKGEKLAALELDSLDIAYKPGPLSNNNVIGREVDSDDEEEDSAIKNPAIQLNSLEIEYKPCALSNYGKLKQEKQTGKRLIKPKVFGSSEGSMHSKEIHSLNSMDSRKLYASALLTIRQASLGIPLCATCNVLFWSPTSISVADFVLGSDIPQQNATSSTKSRCFNAIFFISYLVLIVFAVTTHISSTFFINMGFIGLTIVSFLLLVDAIVNGQNIQLQLAQQVNWSILMFFFCFFVWIAGFQKTNVIRWLWFRAGFIDVQSYSQLALSTLVISGFAYVCGPVISVLLLLDVLDPCRDQLELVLLLAWCTGVAGNFSPAASVAPLLTAHASIKQFKCRTMFWRHLSFSLPTSLIILVLGVVVIHCLNVVF